uniref:RBR-type E3 ubiquitin transferase n=1 Tax=Solanum lycopersicum TaxID=4081 RepID=A0A3Q7FUK3_SOLLC
MSRGTRDWSARIFSVWADWKGDVMLMGIAKNKKWRKCPKCKCYVEKGEGCFQLTCRCGHDFCYRCGMVHESQHICPST